MGFGIIFIGYLFTVFDMGFIVNEALLVLVCKALTFIGYTVLTLGLSKYSKYSRYARYALIFVILLDAAYLFDGAVQALWFFGVMKQSVMANIRTYTFGVNAVLFAAAQITLMYAVLDTAKQTGAEKVRKNAVRSVAATAGFSIVNTAAALFNLGDVFSVARYAVFIIVTAMNALTLYSAYRYICLDTELEAEQTEALKERLDKKGR